ncbi:MAG TPA: acetyl-CoA carboxylase biotin carboxyl carrier protein [Bryobacteraceae bacterium]|jgi:acetyl-CoA carboxylase biotin carboxyl carrier protein|nr:acetyl-CoA carboxylase biotin carboxyl carrier protein [Bryobacteraceae bacterium]
MLTWSIAMTLEEIRELIRLVSETGVAELEVQRGENRVRIRQAPGAETSVLLPASPMPQPAAVPPPPSASSPEPAPPKENDNTTYVKSPIVGTFYESASPGTPPFVRIGEHVTPGKVLCIIESMKLMNEIEADMAGIVESRLVENGQPVEYGEALFGIRPV